MSRSRLPRPRRPKATEGPADDDIDWQARRASGPVPRPTPTPLTAMLEYIGAVDEFTAIFGDAPRIEMFTPVPDVELIFNAASPGELLGLILRGARLGRAPTWLAAVATIAGPTLWRAYEKTARPASDLVGHDVVVVAHSVDIPAAEAARLRQRTWLALHQSLHEGQWWASESPALPPAEPAADGADEPWVVVAPWPGPAQPTNLVLPAPLAALCGVEPIGYVRRLGAGLEIRFDLGPETTATDVEHQLALAVPNATTTPAVDVDREVVVVVEPMASVPADGFLVVVAKAVATGNKDPRFRLVSGGRPAAKPDATGEA